MKQAKCNYCFGTGAYLKNTKTMKLKDVGKLGYKTCNQCRPINKRKEGEYEKASNRSKD